MKQLSKWIISGLLSYCVLSMIRFTQNGRIKKSMVFLAEEAMGEAWEDLSDDFKFSVKESTNPSIKQEIKNLLVCLVPGMGWGAVLLLAFVTIANEETVRKFGNVLFSIVNLFADKEKDYADN